MKILAFDTSTAQGSVAVLEGDRVLSERIWRREKSHSEFLTSEIDEALKESNLKISELEALAVGQGPGSFTGIRVSINAARSLAYALSKPVYVFETSQLLAAPVKNFELPLLTIVNAQKNSFFVSVFEPRLSAWHQTKDVSLMSLSELESALQTPHLCLGDGFSEVQKLLSEQSLANAVRDPHLSDFPLASSLGLLTISQHPKPSPLVWNQVQPLYLRASGAEEKLREESKS